MMAIEELLETAKKAAYSAGVEIIKIYESGDFFFLNFFFIILKG